MLKTQAILTSFSSNLDGSASIRFSTQELADEDFLIVKKHQGKHGHLLFSDDEIQDADIPRDKITMEGKTPAQRLRAVLFLISKNLGKDPDDYYRTEMERITNHYKTKIDE